MDNSQPTIFVAIAAYNDPELPLTLDNCLAMARHPENLRFGVCWQFDDQVPIDVDRFKDDKRFRFAEYSVQESEGGSWARYITQGLWDSETYTMQIDSHMTFAPGWDASLTRMMRTLPADRPIITMIAPLFEIDEDRQIRRHMDSGIRATRLLEWNRQLGWTPWFGWGNPIERGESRNRFLSGQFVFTLGRWNEDVRQDPHHYYWGEEFALSLRSFTHGYDFFLPDEMVIWHMLHSKAPPRRHWEHGEDTIAAKNRVAFERLRRLAYSDDPEEQKELGRFGLGNKRTRSDYERFAGMDLHNKIAHPDVFTGRCPDPVTIRSDTDWNNCIDFETARVM